MRAACHLIQMPSPELRAREDAESAERGRQERMRRRQENHEAQAAGRVRLEARTAVERASLQEVELCGKRMIPPQEAERERARGGRADGKEEDEGVRRATQLVSWSGILTRTARPRRVKSTAPTASRRGSRRRGRRPRTY
jgi:hypothetical protein